jgi:hypothetical protein
MDRSVKNVIVIGLLRISLFFLELLTKSCHFEALSETPLSMKSCMLLAIAFLRSVTQFSRPDLGPDPCQNSSPLLSQLVLLSISGGHSQCKALSFFTLNVLLSAFVGRNAV